MNECDRGYLRLIHEMARQEKEGRDNEILRKQLVYRLINGVQNDNRHLN